MFNIFNTKTKNLKKLALVSGAVMGAMVIGATSANASTKIDQNHVRVEQGDTVSQIAKDNGTTVDALAQANHLTNPDLIFVGDNLVLTPNADNNNNQSANVQDNVQPASQATNKVAPAQTTNQASQTSQAPVAQSAKVTTQQSATNSSVNLSGNSMAALRRSIESGGNYNTNTGNGYIGAYQFAPQTIAGIESATGMKWSMDPATQDAFANYYANTRYGSWENVPTTGGW